MKYQFTGEVSYDLPIGKGRAINLGGLSNELVGGWTANGILYLSTGIPLPSPTAGALNSNGISYFNQRANLTCNPSLHAPHTATEWISPACFKIPASPFVPGSAPAYLDHARTMDARDLDLSIYKAFPMGEERNLRLEVSSYNVTNMAQLVMPNIPSITAVETQSNTLFGNITSTVNQPRQFQFGARFTF